MQQKEASIGLLLGSLAAGEAMMKGLQFLGKKSSDDLINVGVKHGKEGLRMNPLTEKQFKNYLGGKQFEPYLVGQNIGKRMQGKEPSQQERFLNRVKGLAKARKERIDSEHGLALIRQRASNPYGDIPKKNEDPLLQTISKINPNEQGGKMRKLLEAKPVDANKKTPVQDFTGNLLSAPVGYLDHRIAARPIIRGLENTNTYQNAVNALGQKSPSSKNILDMARNWYD